MEQVTADGVTGAMVQDEEEEGMPVQVIINGATGVGFPLLLATGNDDTHIIQLPFDTRSDASQDRHTPK